MEVSVNVFPAPGQKWLEVGSKVADVTGFTVGDQASPARALECTSYPMILPTFVCQLDHADLFVARCSWPGCSSRNDGMGLTLFKIMVGSPGFFLVLFAV